MILALVVVLGAARRVVTSMSLGTRTVSMMWMMPLVAGIGVSSKDLLAEQKSEAFYDAAEKV